MTMETDETTDSNRKVISSGNVELDSRLGEGLPIGSLTLIEGGSGSGKSVLSQQLLWGALQDNYRVSLFTSENTVKSLVSQMASIDLDILDFLLLGKFRVFPIEPARLGEEAPFILLAAMKKENEKDIIIVDSFTSAIARTTEDTRIISFFEECKRICAKETTVIVTLHPEAIGTDLGGPLRAKCDAHLVLKAEQDGQRLVKTLQVNKIRGAASVTGGIVGFEVEPGWGMRVIPISKARG